jgi:hypothetical protein
MRCFEVRDDARRGLSYGWPSVAKSVAPSLIQHICQLLCVLHAQNALSGQVGNLRNVGIGFWLNLHGLATSMTLQMWIVLCKNEFRLLGRVDRRGLRNEAVELGVSGYPYVLALKKRHSRRRKYVRSHLLVGQLQDMEETLRIHNF